MKKVLSLALAAALVLGMSATAFAAIKDDYKTMAQDITFAPAEGKVNPNALADTETHVMDDVKDDNVTRPEAKVKLYLVHSTVGLGLSGRNVTKADVKNAKIGIQIRATEGSALVDSYKLDYEAFDGGQVAFVNLKMVKEFVSTKEQDFTIKVYVTVDKSRLTTSEIEVSGTLENEVTNVSEGDDYVNLSDTHVVEADDYIRSIKVDLGEGVAIHTKMFEGKKYYGSVSQEVKAEEEAVLAQYPDINTVYYLKTIGLSSTGDTVEFDLADNNYVYVQDADGNLVYLGRTNDRLPYYTKYFLSTKELDVATDVPTGDDDGNEEPTTELPNMGGDDAPANINDNPSTGR